jgi:hypothetical protein
MLGQLGWIEEAPYLSSLPKNEEKHSRCVRPSEDERIPQSRCGRHLRDDCNRVARPKVSMKLSTAARQTFEGMIPVNRSSQ